MNGKEITFDPIGNRMLLKFTTYPPFTRSPISFMNVFIEPDIAGRGVEGLFHFDRYKFSFIFNYEINFFTRRCPPKIYLRIYPTMSKCPDKFRQDRSFQNLSAHRAGRCMVRITKPP